MRKLSVLFFIFLFFLSISIASANEFNLDINAELVDNKVDNLNLKENIPLEQNLAIRFTIVNSNNLWISADNFGIMMTANKDGERFFPISSVIDTLTVEKLVIPPQDKAEFYVVLEEYNLLSKNDRIGSWAIKFESTKPSTDGFEASDLTKDGYVTLYLIKPNNIEFTVIKEKAYLDENTNFLSILSNYNLNTINSIVGIIVGILFILGFLWGIFKFVSARSNIIRKLFSTFMSSALNFVNKIRGKSGKYQDFIEEDDVQSLLAHFKIEGIEISSDNLYHTFEDSKDNYDKFKDIIGFSQEIESKYIKPSHSIHSDYITIYRKYFNPLFSPYYEEGVTN